MDWKAPVNKKTFAIVMAILCLGLAYSIMELDNLVDDFQSAAKDRRNQTCKQDEENYIRSVRQVEQTYKYIGSLNAQQVADPLNTFIIRNLSQTLEDAKAEKAPEFCYTEEVGLKTDKPKFPDLKDYPKAQANIALLAVEQKERPKYVLPAIKERAR